MRSMIDTPEIRALGRFLDIDVFRQGVIASNLANIDTPGYRSRDINFRLELARAGGGGFDHGLAADRETQSETYAEISNPGAEGGLTPLARRVPGLIDRPDGNNVSLERETLLMAQTQLRFSVGTQLLRAEFRMLSSAIHEGSPS